MEEKKIQLGELEASLVNDVDSYVKLVNEHKPKGNKNISRTGLIRSYFKELLADKVLTKDFIELEHHYYFNKKELLENGTVKAVPEEPSSAFENYYTIKKVPNNLDSFNEDAKTYSYGTKANVHKGIFIYHVHLVKFSIAYAKAVPLLFYYDAEAEEITVSLIKSEELEYLIKSEEDVETIISLVQSEEDFQKNFKFINEEGVEELNISVAFSDKELGVIEDYKGRKAIDLLVNYNVDVLGASEETSSEIKYSVDLNNPIEDLVNSNAAKDKELKELEEHYKKPMEDFVKKVKELDNTEDREIIWNEIKKEQEEE